MAPRKIRDCDIVDDTLDLSLNDLQDVPVKEIAAFPKATSLDLSNNKLTTLNKSFAVSLTHLVKLDLARNELRELPKNFGLLVNLKYLDLYKNKLETLPLSFANLKSLRWLDLKENPLEPHWHQIVGPCLNAQDCKSAAKNVVNIASLMSEEIECEIQRSQARQKQQEENEENELREQAKKREKQREKKRRRNAAKLAESKPVVEYGLEAEDEPSSLISGKPSYSMTESSETISFNISEIMRMIFRKLLGFFFTFVVILFFATIVFYFTYENGYKRIMANLNIHFQTLNSLVPGHVSESVRRTSVKVLSNVKDFSITSWHALNKFIIHSYMFVTTDPKFEALLNDIINAFLSMYVTLCNCIRGVFYTLLQPLLN